MYGGMFYGQGLGPRRGDDLGRGFPVTQPQQSLPRQSLSYYHPLPFPAMSLMYPPPLTNQPMMCGPNPAMPRGVAANRTGCLGPGAPLRYGPPLNGGGGFMMQNQNSFGPPHTMQQRMGSLRGMNMISGPDATPHLDSFRGSWGDRMAYERSSSFRSLGSNSNELQHANSSSVIFRDSSSVTNSPGQVRRHSYGSLNFGDSAFMNSASPAMGGNDFAALSSRDGSMASYNYGAAPFSNFGSGGSECGPTGTRPGPSPRTLRNVPPVTHIERGERNGGGDNADLSAAPPVRQSAPFPRRGSYHGMQGSHAGASNAADDGSSYGHGGNTGPYGGFMAAAAPSPSNRFPLMPGTSFRSNNDNGSVMLNALNATVAPRGGVEAMLPSALPATMPMVGPQRPLYAEGGPASVAPPSKGTSENAVVGEGLPQALGRKNSLPTLSRQASEKRVGMYFKNKEASEVDGVQYKKDGDPGTAGKSVSRAQDPTLANTVKASLLLDISRGMNGTVEVDGRTIRAERPGADEVQKYDLRDVMYVNRETDEEVLSDSLEEMRDNAVMGCNVGMIMADAGCPSSRPTEWFSWVALKSVVKGVFGKMGSTEWQFTVSVCLLQEDQVMDLLADPPQRFVTLTVEESPLFGNVAHGMVYVSVETAGEFNEVLDECLSRAQDQQSPAAEEHGIVLCTCVLKQVRTSTSSNKTDVVISSIFASGVGDGVIHYNRIMDKNPAEPRALFYAVMHRSVHATALFSCCSTDDEVFAYLATLQRFSKIETRRPKLGSLRAFISYGSATIPKIREDLDAIREPRKRLPLVRQLEKLELMVSDAKSMLASPSTCVPKTYL